MGLLSERVVAVTGAGRGVGREIALLCAKEGASVVVNDLGGSADGEGADISPAQETVNDIKAAGGKALANGASVSDPKGAARIIEEDRRSVVEGTSVSVRVDLGGDGIIKIKR